ncbi:MAG: PatB family C-S lyase [Bacteroidales bacterium]|nr:PatB family C-S lyase [Bacteroidales bacterium]
MKRYDFDEIVPRRGSNCLKYDMTNEFFGSDDLLPMWIADMDFRTPDFVLDALRQRLDHPVMGYFFNPEGYFQAIVNWMQRRHGWNISAKWICFSPGVVAGLSFLVQNFTDKGDRVLIQPPVYPPFFEVVRKNDRQLLFNPLRIEGDAYVMDYDDLEAQLKKGPKMMILCNPHNPVGRSWTPEELRRVAELCLRYHCLLVSDEIHSDLMMRGQRHTPVATLSDEIAQNTITCMAPSKTFNLAGMFTSEIIIPNPELRARYKNFLNDTVHIYGNLFGSVAAQAAYTHGADWLDQLRDYLTDNVAYCKRFIAEQMPELRTYRHEATYLLWVNFQGLGLSHQELTERLVRDAHLGLNDGQTFGDAGEQCMRVNLACPRSTVEEAMQRLLKVKK